MQKKVVDWLYNLQSRWGILKEEERSLYEYAYRLLLSRILIYSIIINSRLSIISIIDIMRDSMYIYCFIVFSFLYKHRCHTCYCDNCRCQ